MESILETRFARWVDREYGVDTEGWTIAQIGSQYWVADGRGKPIILLGRSAPVALGHLKGMVHGGHIDQTLIHARVLLPNWEDLQ